MRYRLVEIELTKPLEAVDVAGEDSGQWTL